MKDKMKDLRLRIDEAIGGDIPDDRLGELLNEILKDGGLKKALGDHVADTIEAEDAIMGLFEEKKISPSVGFGACMTIACFAANSLGITKDVAMGTFSRAFDNKLKTFKEIVAPIINNTSKDLH